MSQAPKRSRYEAMAAATAQFYNSTGTVPTNIQLPADISYMITTQPCPTILVADIPQTCTENDLIGIFSRYGQVTAVQLVCNGRVALVEFAEISPPTRLVHMAKINPFFVGPNRVRLEFSSQTISSGSSDRKVVTQQADNTGPTRILHLDIANADYPITVDVIKAICAPHGKLQRIFIGKKNVDRSLEALVEFETIEEARRAKEHLDGADIYSGCCSLTVACSRLQRVHVTRNDTESWDFTGTNANREGPLNNASSQRTLLGPAASQPPPPTTVVQAQQTPTILPPLPTYQYQQPAYPFPTGFPVPPHIQSQQAMGFYGTPPPMAFPPHPPLTHLAYPAMPYGQPMYHPVPPTGHQVPMPVVTSTAVTSAQESMAPAVILPTPAPVHHVTPGGIGIGHATSNIHSTSGASVRQKDMSIFESMQGTVLMACNLHSSLNCDHLFNLLCVYGNIARIKFLKTRPGCAMIQVGTAESADLVHRYFDGIPVFGQLVQFYHSKQYELTEHDNLGTLADGSPVMKNYMIDPNNRFRNPMVAAKSRILEPSRTLHFFNAPLNITPNDMFRVFTEAGAKRPSRLVFFTPKSGQKTSLGLVEWEVLTDALDALVLCNHRPIHLSGFAHPFHLKLAFSPKPISDEAGGLAAMGNPAISVTSQSSATTTLLSTFPQSNAPGSELSSCVNENAGGRGANSGSVNTNEASSLSFSGFKRDVSSHSAMAENPIAAGDGNVDSATVDVDAVEAAEAAYLEGLSYKLHGTSDSNDSALAKSSCSDDHNELLDRHVGQPPTTPPSEPEDDEETDSDAAPQLTE